MKVMELQDEQDETEVTTSNITKQVSSVQHCINLLEQVESRFIECPLFLRCQIL